MKSILIGKKGKPTYLVEIQPKKLTIYKPDRHSKQEDFYEQYVLGNPHCTTRYGAFYVCCQQATEFLLLERRLTPRLWTDDKVR